MAKIPKPKVTIGREAQTIDAARSYDDKEFNYDPKGYFLIRINRDRKKIEVGHCKQNNVILALFQGNNARELCQAIIKAGLISRLDHAAYIGRECLKAEAALKFNVEYVQDTDIVAPRRRA